MESIEKSLRGLALRSSTMDKQSGEIQGEFLFDPDFPAFAGHFPQRPVLPAIVQLAAVRVAASAGLGKTLIPSKLVRVKFKNMIGPDEVVKIAVKIKAEDEFIRLSFTLDGENGRAAVGEMICGVEG